MKLIRDFLATAIGTCLIFIAIGCYKFDWPREMNKWENIIEFALGSIILSEEAGITAIGKVAVSAIKARLKV